MSASYAEAIGLRVVPEVEHDAPPMCPPHARRCHVAASRCAVPSGWLRVGCAGSWSRRDCAPVPLERCDTVLWRWV